MKTNNKIILGLWMVLLGFIQNINAYKYTITNNTANTITVEMVTTFLGAPKPKVTLTAGQTQSKSIKGFYAGACLGHFNVNSGGKKYKFTPKDSDLAVDLCDNLDVKIFDFGNALVSPAGSPSGWNFVGKQE